MGDGKWERKGEGYQKNLRIFNIDVSEEEYQKIRKLLTENDIKIQLTEVIDGGLKAYSYQDAWSNFWDKSNKIQKDCILNIKQFDAEIFKEITGIDVSKKDTKNQELLNKADELIKEAVNGLQKILKIIKDEQS